MLFNLFIFHSGTSRASNNKAAEDVCEQCASNSGSTRKAKQLLLLLLSAGLGFSCSSSSSALGWGSAVVFIFLRSGTLWICGL